MNIFTFYLLILVCCARRRSGGEKIVSNRKSPSRRADNFKTQLIPSELNALEWVINWVQSSTLLNFFLVVKDHSKLISRLLIEFEHQSAAFKGFCWREITFLCASNWENNYLLNLLQQISVKKEQKSALKQFSAEKVAKTACCRFARKSEILFTASDCAEEKLCSGKKAGEVSWLKTLLRLRDSGNPIARMEKQQRLDEKGRRNDGDQKGVVFCLHNYWREIKIFYRVVDYFAQQINGCCQAMGVEKWEIESDIVNLRLGYGSIRGRSCPGKWKSCSIASHAESGDEIGGKVDWKGCVRTWPSNITSKYILYWTSEILLLNLTPKSFAFRVNNKLKGAKINFSGMCSKKSISMPRFKFFRLKSV